MSKNDHLKELKSAARHIARAQRIKHLAALEIVAQALGHSHWRFLVEASKTGWQPSQADIGKLNEMAIAENPLESIDSHPELVDGSAELRGELLGHSYAISLELDDVTMSGRGWKIFLPEAPSADAKVSVTDRRIKDNPISDPAFRDAAMEVAMSWRRRVQARIASDWPKRSTVPDHDGRAKHPLFGEVQSRWFCLHCDGEFTGKQMAENLWHCPSCHASPIDIFSKRWWNAA